MGGGLSRGVRQWQALANSDSGFEAMESPEFQVHADCRFYLELERLA